MAYKFIINRTKIISKLNKNCDENTNWANIIIEEEN